MRASGKAISVGRRDSEMARRDRIAIYIVSWIGGGKGEANGGEGRPRWT